MAYDATLYVAERVHYSVYYDCIGRVSMTSEFYSKVPCYDYLYLMHASIVLWRSFIL